MTITIELNNGQEAFIKKAAELKGLPVGKFARWALFEAAEEQLDIKAAERAIAEFETNPVTYSMAETEMMLLGHRLTRDEAPEATGE